MINVHIKMTTKRFLLKVKKTSHPHKLLSVDLLINNYL